MPGTIKNRSSCQEFDISEGLDKEGLEPEPDDNFEISSFSNKTTLN